MTDAAESDAIARLPCWRGRVAIEPLHGGMTNRNLLVTDADGARYVARVGFDLPEHGVMRFNEQAAARAAHAAGLSPEVVHAGPGVLVSRYIDGRTYAPEDVRRELPRIVDLLRRCHHEVPLHFRGPALVFWVFQVVRSYLCLLREPGANPLALPLEDYAARAVALERALGPVHIAFGHNDLLAANVIDDGTRLWLIDFDYAGFNTPLFDLANLASNNAFDAALEAELLSRYFGVPPDAALRRAFAAMGCASLLRELLWGAVSLVHSRIAFDYASYVRDYGTRFETAWRRVLEEGTRD